MPKQEVGMMDWEPGQVGHNHKCIIQSRYGGHESYTCVNRN